MNGHPIQKNALDALAALVRHSHIRVTRRTLAEKLEQHPGFPSLASLRDTLDEFGVSTLAVDLPSDKLTEIPLPALAQVRTDGERWAVIRAVTPDYIEWLDTRRGWQQQTLTDFSKIWSGITLLVEASPQSGEANYDQRRHQERLENSRYPLLVVGLVIWVVIFLTYSFQQTPVSAHTGVYGLLALKALGLGLSSLLIASSLTINSPFLVRICQVNKRTNCQDILQSKAAQVFSWLSWSEVGLLYFSGGLLSVAFTLVLPVLSAVQVLLWLNLVALPYTFYSVYYQAFVARQWCVLCSLVQGVLWLEFFNGLSLWAPSSAEGIGLILFCFMMPTIGWILLKKPLYLAGEVVPLKRELFNIKFNDDYLEWLSQHQPQMPPYCDNMELITLGNATASHTLTFVTNPVCDPCRRAHQELEHLLAGQNELICTIIFSPSTNLSKQIVSELLALPPDSRADALRTWFKREDRSSESIKTDGWEFPPTEESARQLAFHQSWCKQAQIRRTPTFFLDGIELPAYYQVKDMLNLCRTARYLGFGLSTHVR